MNLQKAATALMCAFAFGFPLITGRVVGISNQNGFGALLVFSILPMGILAFSLRSEPLQWSPVSRVGFLVTVIFLCYVVALLVATYGLGLPDIWLLPGLTLGLLFCLLHPAHWQEKMGRRAWIALLTLAALVTASCVLTPHQHVALLGSFTRRTGFLTFLCCVTLFLFVVAFVRTPHDRFRIIGFLLAGGGVTALVAVWQFFDPAESASQWFLTLQRDRRPMATLGHPNWFGTFLCLVLPLAVALYLDIRNTFHRVVTFGLCLLLFAAAVVCQTRGTWIALLCFMAWLAWSRRAVWRNVTTLLIGFSLVTVILIPAKDWEIYQRMTTFGREVSRAGQGSPGAGSSRFGYWMYGFKHMPRHALLGSGLDSYEAVGLKDPLPPPVDKAHSIFIEYAVTMGLTGLVAYLVFLWSCIRLQPGRAEGFLRWGIQSAVLTYLAQGIFIHDTVKTWPILWLLLGLAAAKDHHPENETARAA